MGGNAVLKFDPSKGRYKQTTGATDDVTDAREDGSLSLLARQKLTENGSLLLHLVSPSVGRVIKIERALWNLHRWRLNGDKSGVDAS